jgi:hypothetical protein
MALNVGLCTSLNTMLSWEEMWEEAGEVNNTKTYTANDETPAELSMGVTLVHK